MQTETELQYVQRKMAGRTRQQWKEDADEAGVPFSTFKKIGYGQVENPRSDTVSKIAVMYRAREVAATRAQKRRARALALVG